MLVRACAVALFVRICRTEFVSCVRVMFNEQLSVTCSRRGSHIYYTFFFSILIIFSHISSVRKHYDRENYISLDILTDSHVFSIL
jgi:hypothetical protein